MMHTITRSATTYFRLAILLGVSAVMVWFTPFLGQEFVDFLVNNTLNLGILYAIIVGFIMSIVLGRRQALDQYVHLELNKIRRIYHLVLHIKKADAALGGWYEDVRAAIRAYLHMFAAEGFAAYMNGDQLFRRVTYALYELPTRSGNYNAELYAALLDAAASATEGREFVHANAVPAVGRFQWFVLLTVTLAFAFSFAALTPVGFVQRAIAVVLIFTLLLVLDLIWEYDHPNVLAHSYLSDLYAHDLDTAEGFLDYGRTRPQKNRS